MNSMKRLCSALLIGAAGFGLFVACGGNNGGADDCVLDGDCAEGEVCEAQICVPTCESDADCADGEVCEEGVNTTSMVCKSSGGTNNGVNNGVNNGSNNGTNNGGATLYYIVEIQDTSSGDEACSIGDPGSDLFGVALEDFSGNVIAWGEFVNNEEGDVGGGEVNEYSDVSVISGAPASGKDCPGDFADDSVYSLGCGGSLWVEFKDNGGQVVALDATQEQQITVYEYGSQCGGSDVDSYSINICENTEGARNGETGACTINILQGGEGLTSGTVSGF